MSEAALRVFVYGTLKPGECNYSTYCAENVTHVEAAIALGHLFDLPLGYPAATTGDRPIYGYLLSFANSSVLQALDALEDYNARRPENCNEYIRRQTEVFDLDQRSLGFAWIYSMRLPLITQMGGVLLPDGNWTGQGCSS